MGETLKEIGETGVTRIATGEDDPGARKQQRDESEEHDVVGRLVDHPSRVAAKFV